MPTQTRQTRHLPAAPAAGRSPLRRTASSRNSSTSTSRPRWYVPATSSRPCRQARRRDERGAASLAQTVIVAPVLLFVLMLIVQFGLMFHARNVAEQAAQSGAAQARRYDGTAGAGQQRAEQYLASVVSKTLNNRSVSADRDANTATVTVTGTVVSLIPGLHLKVEESASGPVERYVPPTAAGGQP